MKHKNREELLKSRGYWITKTQIDLFNQINNYLEKENMTKTRFAEKLGVTKGYVTQILNGDYDHKISKWIDLTLAIGKAPLIFYVGADSEVEFLTVVDRRSNTQQLNFIVSIDRQRDAIKSHRTNNQSLFAPTISEKNIIQYSATKND